MRCYGLPFHAWSSNVFEFLDGTVGTFVCYDVETQEHKRLDVAPFLIRTKSSMVFNESLNLEVNEHVYESKLVEDMHGPQRIVIPHKSDKADCSSDSSDEEADEDGGTWSSGDPMESNDEDNTKEMVQPKTSQSNHGDNGTVFSSS